jgi:hypothetical protein
MVENLLSTCFKAGLRMGLLFPSVVSVVSKQCLRGINLPYKHIHPTIQAIFDITFFRKGTERDNRGRVSHLPNKASALKTIEDGHLRTS